LRKSSKPKSIIKLSVMTIDETNQDFFGEKMR